MPFFGFKTVALEEATQLKTAFILQNCVAHKPSGVYNLLKHLNRIL